MKSAERMGLLATIWFSMALVGIGIATGSDTPELLIIPITVALLLTVVMVLIPDIIGALATEREKAKRQPQNKLSLLMDLMDEDERAAFKQALMQRVLDDMTATSDSELPASDESLAGLLDRDREHAQSRR